MTKFQMIKPNPDQERDPKEVEEYDQNDNGFVFDEERDPKEVYECKRKHNDYKYHRYTTFCRKYWLPQYIFIILIM